MARLKETLAFAVREIIADFHDDDELDLDAVEVESTHSDTELIVLVRLPDELHEDGLVQAVFHDVFYHLELEQNQGTQYRLQWEVYDKPSAEKPCHVWLMQSEISKLPETGLPEEDTWQEFVEQLVFTRDGVPQEMHSPFD